MKPHIRIYRDHFDLAEDDRIVCEWCCQREAVDVHHIDPRGMGGSKKKDYIENLMGLCRVCHTKAHDEELSGGVLLGRHLRNI